MKYIRKYGKTIAVSFITIFLVDLLYPVTVYAITGHESMPEYRSFEPVATTNLVNNFNGSFTYNIPLLEIPNGYPISLSYHSSEVNTDALASWVGLGWTLNPGAINRNKRGFPDEYKNKKVRYHNKMPASWTVSKGFGTGIELYSNDLLSIPLGASVRYNNYTGLGTVFNTGLSIAGVLNANFTASASGIGFNPSVNPFRLLNVRKTVKERNEEKTKEPKMMNQDERLNSIGLSYGGMSGSLHARKNSGSKKYNTGNHFQSSLVPETPYPTTLAKYSGFMANATVSLGVNVLPLPFDTEASINGSFALQKNQNYQDVNVYGYHHNESALGDEEAMMDYFTENEKPFEKRDRFLGYPLPNNDVYSLTGEAMGGSFRSFRGEYGHYRKNKIRSGEVHIGFEFDYNAPVIAPVSTPPIVSNHVQTLGYNAGIGYHWTSVSGFWDPPTLDEPWNDGAFSEYMFRGGQDFPKSGENYFFRFSGDKAGFYSLSGSDQAVSAGISSAGLLTMSPSLAQWESNSIGQNLDYRNSGRNKKRSTYISQHKNSDFSQISQVNQEPYKYKVYEKKLEVLDNYTGNVFAYNHTHYPSEATGEMVTYNNDGVSYVYGLPVYARNEKQLQVGTSPDDFDSSWDFNSPLEGGGQIAYIDNAKEVADDTKRIIGYEAIDDENEYPTTHLLTQILGPDYVDRTANGPTPDDFGSFTRFNYQRVSGGVSNPWYGYRTPYTGVQYDYGSLSDNRDDMGGFSYGEKEVYYLHSIVSKTHVAIFTIEDRSDGMSAKLSNDPDLNELVVGEDQTASTQSLKKLKRIDLYALEDCELIQNSETSFYQPKVESNKEALPIKTVHFEYDYELSNNTPNSLNETGKLTLKKIWFEFGGQLKSKTSPYLFEYKYPNPTQTSYPSPYTALLDEYSHLGDIHQNPDYRVINTDRWGNYRDFFDLNQGIGDLSRFWPYVHQNPGEYYDPAAWCLKNITLPSGGEIHVQYEQNDYHYVQNKRAMVMVPLLGDPYTDEDETSVSNKKYYLNLDAIRIDYNTIYNSQPASYIQSLADDLFAPMKNRERLYFNFLYSLIGNTVDFSSTNTDFLNGFAKISGYGFDQDGIYFCFRGGDTHQNFTSISYGSGGVNKKEMPRKVCKNFYKTQRRARIGPGSSNALANADIDDDTDTFKDKLEQLSTAIDNILSSTVSCCRKIDPAMSYVRLRIPESLPKYGGGVRVKRILSFDPGMEEGDPSSLYGQEFSYKLNNGMSSGVATNEPGEGRRESALVNPIDKDHQSKLNAIMFGEDMYGMEGPIGESLLPPPSIGYSKVTVRNIHKGKTSTGSEVHEFYTCKEYPFKFQSTPVSRGKEKPKSVSFSFSGISINYERVNPYLTQGFVFKSYSMHGQPKGIKKYANNSNNPISKETYTYYHPKESVRVMGDDLKESVVLCETLGKESEILSEARQVRDEAIDIEIGVDVTQVTGTDWIMIFPPLVPTPTPLMPITYSPVIEVNGGASMVQSIYRTHVTSKVINYPVLQKSMIVEEDGVRHVTLNEVFDANSGEPVITRSFDDFSGQYINQEICASWNYDNLKSKYKNQRLKLSGASLDFSMEVLTDGDDTYIQFSGDNSCGVLSNFIKGDYVQLFNSSSPALYHIDKVDYNNDRLYILKSMLSEVDFTGNVNSLEVIFSGYNNRLSTKTGKIIYHSEGELSYFTGEDNLSTNHPFVSDLNNSLEEVQGSNGTISLNGEYSGMNIANYSHLIPLECDGQVDIYSATINNVEIEYEINANEVTFLVVGFQLSECAGVLFDCEPES